MAWLPQLFLLGLAFVLARWVQAPTVALAGLGAITAGVLLQSRTGRAAYAITIVGSIAMWASVFGTGVTWSLYFLAPASLIFLALAVSRFRVKDASLKPRLNFLAAQWLLAGSVMWLGAGYAHNEKFVFFTGLAAVIGSLLIWRFAFPWSALAAQSLSTLILLLIGLPMVDAVLRPHSATVQAGNCQRYYSFNAAKGDPEAFGRWEEFYTTQFDKLGTALFTPAPGTSLPFRLQPGASTVFINCPISVNSRGFRGSEFSNPKSDVYRIVALGESTTFGMTVQRGDKPWPEVLEQLIHERLKTRKPVEVINAGVPAYSIVNNVSRLHGEILPLQPDMIISYHGANAFTMLDASVLPPLGPPPPIYRERPLKIAANLEHKLRMALFRRAALKLGSRAANSFKTGDPLQTPYAAAYRQLIGWSRSNGVKLALANYSMAVNKESPQNVIDFYQGGGSRAAYGFMRANAVHSEIARGLAAENPGVCFIDTHPRLDGDHEKFIDLIHFTGEGDRQLAENVFAGISNTLARDLSPAP